MKTKLLYALTAVFLFLISHVTFGQAPNLGTTSSFALYTGSGAINNSGVTLINGDVGTNVGAFNGFPPGIVNGNIHVADAAAAQALIDVGVAYGQLSAIPCGSVIGVGLGNNQTLAPGVYCTGAASTLTGNLILDAGGNTNAVFIFKIGGALSTASLSSVTLINGASLCNVYWQVDGATSLGITSSFRGTIVSNGAINLLQGATLIGRGLTTAGAINLDGNVVDVAMRPIVPVITANGALTFCIGGSVTLSGNINGGTWSTGATTPSITVTASGTYSITNTTNCGSSTASVVVTVNPLPSCVITGNLSLCFGQSTQLCAPLVIGSTYLWSNGGTTNCITVNTAGNYAVTITSALGCVSTCNVNVTVALEVPCLITGNLSIALGQSTQLCVSSVVGSTYIWSNGGTTNCINVNATGTYSVTVTNLLGCVSTCNVTVVSQIPCVITGNLSLCFGQSTQLCVPLVVGSTYIWSNGGTTNCITVNTAGNYAVTITTAGGVVSTCNVNVTVALLPNCTITGNSSVCAGQSIQLCTPLSATATYLWSTGATTNCINVNTAGTFSVTVTEGGCQSICSKVITLNPLPNCTITGNSPICQGQSTQLCTPLSATATYLWSTGATTNCITVNTAGNYSVTVTEGGCQSVCNKTVVVNPLPICTITGNSSICNGQSIQLCTPLSATATYLWSTGATTNCINVNTAGTFSVTVTEGGCQSVCSKIITLNQPPICTITGNSSVCAGQSIQLCTPLSATATYLWSTGATTNCITVNAAGTYTVTVTDANGCSSICSKIITINPLPSCLITGNSSICAGQSTQLCVAAGFASYLWSTGATTNCITVNAAGTYTVTVTDANGCSSVCSQIVTVTQQPTCLITGNGSICPGQSTQLCVPAGALSYLWSTGATTNCITVNAAGTYSVTVTQAVGCISVCSKVVILNPQPTCLITGNASICLGQSTQLCVPAGALSYLWSTGATTNCINVNAAGTYSVTVTEAVGCTSICSKIVTLNQQPTCLITGNGSICQGQSTQLCVPAGSASYLWSTGATTNCITVSVAGNYSVTVTESIGCVSTCSKIVTVNPLPSCLITGNGSICQGQSTQLCAPAGSASYLWSTGATTNCITVNATGTYTVTVTNINGCISICSKIVTVNPLPICTITGNSSVCNGQTIQLCTPLSATATYLWSTGATTNCINVNTAGTYSVTVTEGLCSSVCSKIITLNQPPICTITGNSSVCNGQTIQLCTPLSATATYLWSTGATTNCINVNTAGTYSVTVTQAGGCSSVCSKIISANQPPICTITGNSSICNGQSIQLCTPLSATATYLWSTGATTNCINVNAAGTYSVTVTEAGGCSSVCSKIITLNQPSCLITGNGALCQGQTTQLCVPAGSASYLWSTGATTNCITVSAAGTYSVTVTEGGGCRSVCSKIVTVDQLPNCEISGNCNICIGQTTQICVPAGASAYLWSTGATTNCITISAAGNYSVTVTNANGCKSVCSRDVIVNDVPICTLNGFDTICAGQTYQLCVPVGALTYLWSTGATTNCITVNATGFYCVTITNSSGCSSICSKTITVLPAIVLATTVGNASCLATGSITVTASGGTSPYSYLWSNGATTATINNLTGGTYTVTVTDAKGCKAIKSATITTPTLRCDITITQQLSGVNANDAQARVVGSLGTAPYTYLWSNGQTTQTATGLGATTYSATVTDANGCKSICSIVIPNSLCENIINPGVICCNQTICSSSELQPLYETFPASGGAATSAVEYLWMYSYAGGSFNPNTWTAIVGATGKDLPVSLFPSISRPTYIYRCVRRVNCGDFKESNLITITPRAFAQIAGPTTVCINQDVTFTADENTAGATYNWSFTGANVSIVGGRSQTVKFTSVGQKQVILTVTVFGCQRSRVITVNVTSCQDGYGNLMGFVATVNNKDAFLQWTTMDEKKPSMYMIEKSLDNVHFMMIDGVASKNESNNLYTYTDKKPKVGRTFYRIYQMSPINEAVMVSKSEMITIIGDGSSIITYPNPVTSTLFVEVIADNTEGVLEVYDVLGRLIKTKNFVKGQVRYELEVGDLLIGTYIVRVLYLDGNSVATKFLKF